MSTYSWQHFRDEVAQDNVTVVFKHCVESLRLDTVAYMLSLVGYEFDELQHVISECIEDIRQLRDIFATVRYLEQFESSNWFIGLHPSYDERSPIDIFRYREGDIIIDHLRSGARLFALSS
jgi:hypothetical protein